MGRRKSMEELFAGRHFDREVIILCVRWYLRFKLSLRDLVEMMAERGFSLALTTILRWVQRYAPELSGAGIALPSLRVNPGGSTRLR
jgi:transposase-like protein